MAKEVKLNKIGLTLEQMYEVVDMLNAVRAAHEDGQLLVTLIDENIISIAVDHNPKNNIHVSVTVEYPNSQTPPGKTHTVSECFINTSVALHRVTYPLITSESLDSASEMIATLLPTYFTTDLARSMLVESFKDDGFYDTTLNGTSATLSHSFKYPKAIIKAILALDIEGGIGKDNKLPWHLPEDLKRFKELTTGKCIIMGRNTYESIGKPLPNRLNVVITRDASYKADGVTVVTNVNQALREAAIWNSKNDEELSEVYIIGGGTLISSIQDHISEYEITRIHDSFDCDVHLVISNAGEYLVKDKTEEMKSDNGLTYNYERWVKMPKEMIDKLKEHEAAAESQTEDDELDHSPEDEHEE